MPISAWIDQLLPNFLTVGRGTSAIGLKTSTTGVEVRDGTDTAYRDLRIRNLQLDGFAATSRVAVPRRQCALLGQISASTGLPNAFSIGGGLAVQLNASSTNPFVMTFAAGFDALGVPIDYCGTFSLSQVFSSLTANSTNYLYVDRASDGTLTIGRTTLMPIYARVPPASPATGQSWFSTSQSSLSSLPGMTMYEWSGSAWVARQRVFVGEAIAGATNISAVYTYAYQRRYQSPWTAFTAGNFVNFAHLLGMSPAAAEAMPAYYGRVDSSDLSPAVAVNYVFDGNAIYGPLVHQTTNSRLNLNIYLGAGGLFLASNGSGFATSGEMQVSLISQW